MGTQADRLIIILEERTKLCVQENRWVVNFFGGITSMSFDTALSEIPDVSADISKRYDVHIWQSTRWHCEKHVSYVEADKEAVLLCGAAAHTSFEINAVTKQKE